MRPLRQDSSFHVSLIITSLVFALALVGCGTQDTDQGDKSAKTTPRQEKNGPGTGKGAKVQDEEPAFDDVVVNVVDEQQFSEAVAAHEGKVVLVDYWATWCLPCKDKFPATVALNEEYADDGLVVMSLSLDDPDDAMQNVRQFLGEMNADFPHYISRYGGSNDTVEKFDIPDGTVPFYRVFDRQGSEVPFPAVDPAERFSKEHIENHVRSVLGLE